jgi:hypothetical protein
VSGKTGRFDSPSVQQLFDLKESLKSQKSYEILGFIIRGLDQLNFFLA